MDTRYDVIIIGAGPAGLTAGIYCGRYRLRTLILEKGAVGGQITLTSEIENYPGQRGVWESLPEEGSPGMAGLEKAGSPETAGLEKVGSPEMAGPEESGMTLTSRMRDQAAYFGAEFAPAEITGAELAGEIKRLTASDGKVYEAPCVILAGGARSRPIGCENEERFVGCGISYCATCDANFFADLEVYVAGGGDSAIEEALYLTRFARHVTVVHRRDTLRAARRIQEKAFACEKLSFLWNSVIERADGEEVLDRLTIRNEQTGERTVITADPEDGMLGLFGFTGMLPDTDVFAAAGVRLKDGYIDAGEDTHTNLPGVFAAGDIRTKLLRQVVTACADGAVAAHEAEHFLNK